MKWWIIIGLILFTIGYTFVVFYFDIGLPDTFEYMRTAPCTLWGKDYHCEDLDNMNSKTPIISDEKGSIQSVLEAIDNGNN